MDDVFHPSRIHYSISTTTSCELANDGPSLVCNTSRSCIRTESDLVDTLRVNFFNITGENAPVRRMEQESAESATASRFDE